jgi:starvation-inducible DNA-binding protein
MRATIKDPVGVQPNIGIDASGRVAVAEGLVRLLGDTYALQVKTQGYHWNVTGPHFQALHALFEAQYDALSAASDELAERLRALGQTAPGGLAALQEVSMIPEERGAPAWQDMVRRLLEGHEAVIKTARAVLPLAQEAGDEGTVDLVVGRLQEHEKTAWMLRATLS